MIAMAVILEEVLMVILGIALLSVLWGYVSSDADKAVDKRYSIDNGTTDIHSYDEHMVKEKEVVSEQEFYWDGQGEKVMHCKVTGRNLTCAGLAGAIG